MRKWIASALLTMSVGYSWMAFSSAVSPLSKIKIEDSLEAGNWLSNYDKVMNVVKEFSKDDFEKWAGFTMRLLVGKQNVGPEGLFHQFSHVTIAYLGKIPFEVIELLCAVLREERVKLNELKIIDVVRVGAKKDLFAFEVQPDKNLETLISKYWQGFGQLEQWQIEAGVKEKGAMPAKLHITLGKVAELEAKNIKEDELKALVGQNIDLSNAQIDIKSLGPVDPIVTKKLAVTEAR